MGRVASWGLTRIVILLGLGLDACSSPPASPGPAASPARVAVSSVDDPGWSLTVSQRRALQAAGFTQVGMPFGVLVAADEDMPRPYVVQAAAILAEMLDQDFDGQADDLFVVEYLRNREECWLAMPSDPERWSQVQRPRLENALGYDIIIPAWWMGISADFPDERARAVMVEEIHHFMTQFGFSAAYPNIFGVDDWDSVIARETRRAQCDFWQHPENDCPERPAEVPGDCRDPSCDVVEFYHQVVVTRAGMTPSWRGIGFPDSAVALNARLSEPIIRVMNDPQYHQLRQPLRFTYPVYSGSP